jgi:hypothetical protein
LAAAWPLPADRTLFWGRLTMTLSFAGMIAAAASQRICERLATPML